MSINVDSDSIIQFILIVLSFQLSERNAPIFVMIFPRLSQYTRGDFDLFMEIRKSAERIKMMEKYEN